MPNLDKLKGVMVEKGKTYADGARIIGCSIASFSAKMNGKSNFTVPEANDLSNALGLSKEERADIFWLKTCMVCKFCIKSHQPLRKEIAYATNENCCQGA